MNFSEIGKMAEKFWQKIPDHFPHVKLDEFIIMPNHIHGIIIIDNPVETRQGASLRGKNKFGSLTKNSLSSIINHYKGNVKRWCNKKNLDYFQWQPRFYDHIIRDEKSLNKIRKYILNNILKWELDKNNPQNLFM